MAELELEDPAAFKNFVRVEVNMFYDILERVGPFIEKQVTFLRKPLSPGVKQAVTLRFLATGDSYRSLMFGFRVAFNTISKFLPDVCTAIVQEYAEEVMDVPRGADDWRRIADLFSSRWNFHHTVGAMDGKHVAIRCPPNGGSQYYNYKGFHSIVMLALVDADYKFIWVDVGSNGSASDAQIFNSCELKPLLEDGRIDFPQPEPLPHDDRPMPFFFIGDDAFHLKLWMQKPFSKQQMTDMERIFNYRLSRARRISENAFGILAQRFGCLLTTMKLLPPNVEKVVMACVCLHNLLRLENPAEQNGNLDREDDNHNIVPGAWREGRQLVGLEARALRGNVATREAREQRLYLMNYYHSEVGAVDWQDRMI